jgi:hypothetical protein
LLLLLPAPLLPADATVTRGVVWPDSRHGAASDQLLCSPSWLNASVGLDSLRQLGMLSRPPPVLLGRPLLGTLAGMPAAAAAAVAAAPASAASIRLPQPELAPPALLWPCCARLPPSPKGLLSAEEV